jgi:cytochrome c oxidase subunit 1
MHYLGILGMPRRYYAYENYSFIPPSAQVLNEFITVAALIVGVTQLVFIFNMLYSTFRGPIASGNPWRAGSLEWQTPQTPPVHGNWGPELPVVYRGPYDFGRQDGDMDYLPQTAGPDDGGGSHAAQPGMAPGQGLGKPA